MKNRLITILVLGVAAAGCGREHVTAPGPQWRSWDQVVLSSAQGAAGEPGADVSVRSDGALTLVTGGGNAVSSRGLLTGEKLETLTRLVDSLPPSPYSAPDPCSTEAFVMKVVSGSVVRTFASDSCDATVPESVRQLRDFLAEIGASAQSPPRAVIVQVHELLQGTHSAIHAPRRVVLQDRDALVRFLLQHAPDRPSVVSRVDFSRQVVVAEWLGDQPASGYTAVSLEGAEITQSGWFRLRFSRFTPGPACATGDQLTQPFVLVALDRHPEPMLFQDSIKEGDCPAPSPFPGGR
jgi:hypothetical protein